MDLQNIAEGIIEDLSKLTVKKTNADRIRAMSDEELDDTSTLLDFGSRLRRTSDENIKEEN